MKKILLVAGGWLVRYSLGISGLLVTTGSFAQSVSQKLQKAFRQFEADSQLKHAISSLYVIDAKTGKVVFDKNSQVGLAPASTQKIITSVTAFELLGKDFRYQTRLISGKAEGDDILLVYGSGDPTLGSWRWQQTSEYEVKKRWVKAIQSSGLKKVELYFIDPNEAWQNESIPDGWIWQDIGNYYGAGAELFNWRENQYDIILRSGDKVGDPVEIVETIPFVYDLDFECCYLKSAAKGSGDNAYVYYPLPWTNGLIRGTIPIGESRFKISAALPSPSRQFERTMYDTLKKLGIKFNGHSRHIPEKNNIQDLKTLQTEYSPPLDSIVYWFNKKSINLYGEALIKTFSMVKKGFASTDSGVSVVRDFWKQKGLDEDELNISDGSGLSPQNRVTTHAQVTILKYAKTKDWFPYFYDALPEYNGMKMKSGTIRDVKGFCGYQTAKDGKEYIFSFLVNNYNGRTSAVVNKMYKVLDELK